MQHSVPLAARAVSPLFRLAPRAFSEGSGTYRPSAPTWRDEARLSRWTEKSNRMLFNVAAVWIPRRLVGRICRPAPLPTELASLAHAACHLVPSVEHLVNSKLSTRLGPPREDRMAAATSSQRYAPSHLTMALPTRKSFLARLCMVRCHSEHSKVA